MIAELSIKVLKTRLQFASLQLLPGVLVLNLLLQTFSGIQEPTIRSLPIYHQPTVSVALDIAALFTGVHLPAFGPATGVSILLIGHLDPNI